MGNCAIAGTLVIGGQLGNYLIEALIGRGGMSVVYRATHVRLNTPVAVKVLAEELSSDDTFRERFLREAKMAATIDHPNVIPVYDTGLFEDSLYIVMRYVAGGDLRELLTTSGPLSAEQTVELLLPVARALDTAHTHGLVHRDVKPANVLLQRAPDGTVQHVYLSDFGVTKQVGSVSGLTGAGAMVGTVDYMSPEQIQGGEVSPQTDVYALACVFHQCLTGRSPFDRDSAAAILFAHVNADVEPASQVRPGVPPALDAAIAKGMAKQPEDRFASCEQFIQACAAALGAGAAAPGPAFDQGTAAPGPAVDDRGTVAPGPAFDEGAVAPGEEPGQGTAAPDEPSLEDLDDNMWVTFSGTAAVPPPAEPSDVAPPPPPEPPPEPEPEPEPEPPEPEPEPAPPPEPEPAPQPEPEPVAAAPPPEPEPEPAFAPVPVPEPVGATADSSSSPPPAGTAGPGARGWLAERWWLAAVIVLIAGGGIAAAIALSGGGSSSSSSTTAAGTKPKSPAKAAGFPGKLEPVPTNRVNGQGDVVIQLKGNVATVGVNSGGLLAGAPHALHIHAGAKGTCPTAAAARKHGGHRTISTLDGGPFYGPPVAALTTRGDTSPKSILAFARFMRGNIHYTRTFTLPAQVAAYIRESNAVIVVHGIDYNRNGLYDGVLDRSDLDRKFPGEATAPALCGPIVAKSGGQANAGGGEHTYVASLTYATPVDDPWLCHLVAPTNGSPGAAVRLAANPSRTGTAVTGT